MIRRCARSMNTMKVMTPTAITSRKMMKKVDSAPVRPNSQRTRKRKRQLGDDADEDDQRDSVADAARRDLLAQPHQEDGAADQRDNRRQAEEQAGIDDGRRRRDPAHASKPTAMP